MTATPTSQVLGNEDLRILCNRLVLHRFAWKLPNPGGWADIYEMSGRLRARIWRQHCAAGMGAGSCIEQRQPCRCPAECLAQRWLPDSDTTGGASWRMPALYLRHDPVAGEWVLWLLGECNTAERNAVLEIMRAWVGQHSVNHRSGKLDSFAPGGAGCYQLSLSTPWVVQKSSASDQPSEAEFAASLHVSLAQRMKTFAVLALHSLPEPPADEVSRLVGFAARYVAQGLTPAAFQLDACELAWEGFMAPSRSNGKLVPHVVAGVDSLITVQVAAQALPWLTLLAIAGGGKATGKGFGSFVPVKLD